MGSWKSVIFEPGDRDPEDVETDLRRSIRTGEVPVWEEDERDDPNTWIEDDGRVGWHSAGFSLDETFAALEVPCECALAMDVNDTSEAATGFLYEWVDGAFLKTDVYGDDAFGHEAISYFLIEHDLRGKRRV